MLSELPKLKIHEASGDEATLVIDRFPFTIGRHANNVLKIDDPYISRYHAEINREGNQYRLIDKESKSGTYVNGQRITTCMLNHFDKIQFGKNALPEIIFLLKTEASDDSQVSTSTSSLFLSSALGPGAADLRNVSKLLEGARLVSGASLPLGEILDVVLDIAIEVSRAERSFIVLKSHTGEIRFQRGRNNIKESLPESSFKISQTVLKRVIESGEKILMMDSRGQDEFAEAQSIMLLELRTIVCLPLKRFEIVDSHADPSKPSREVIGALYLDSRTATEYFSKISEGILDSLAADATAVIENARLLKESREKERLEMELATAQEIQATLLPKIGGSYSFFEARARNIPSRHISGDYYDLIEFANGNYGFVIADVAGKGVSAAILTSMVQGILYAEAPRHELLGECMNVVNRYLVQRTNGNRFVTLFYGVISSDGTLKFVNAGHNPPYLVRLNGAIEELQSGGVILGVFDFVKYEQKEVMMKPGDFVCLFTDGITEARNINGELYGEERLKNFLQENRFDEINRFVDHVFDEVAGYSRGTPQGDDLSVLILRYGTNLISGDLTIKA